MQREIRPPFTPQEEHEAREVFNHAERRNVSLLARHPVRMRVRCNQIASDMHSVCSFDKLVETTAIAAEGRAAHILREHFIAAHPSLTERDRESLIGRRVSSLRDIPIVTPRRALT